MRRAHVPILFLLPACSLGVRAAGAQTYSCAAANAPATLAVKNYVIRLTGAEPALIKTRQGYQLPPATASQVQIIKTKSICQRAAQAYHRAVRGPSAPQVSRTVVVIKVGTTRYVVEDPAELEGEFNVTVIFDAGFGYLVSYNS